MTSRDTHPDPLALLLHNALRQATDPDVTNWLGRLAESRENACGVADPACSATRKEAPLAFRA
jgi:hypothetical protein